MKKLNIYTITLGVVAILAFSCKSGTPTSTQEEELDCETVTYTASVKPILDSRCIKCHSAPKPKHNINLEHIEGVKAAVDHELMCVITAGEGCPRMPPIGGRLSEVQVKTIECWISNGMPE